MSTSSTPGPDDRLSDILGYFTPFVVDTCPMILQDAHLMNSLGSSEVKLAFKDQSLTLGFKTLSFRICSLVFLLLYNNLRSREFAY